MLSKTVQNDGGHSGDLSHDRKNPSGEKQWMWAKVGIRKKMSEWQTDINEEAYFQDVVENSFSP
jgi:hypothetical protein